MATPTNLGDPNLIDWELTATALRAENDALRAKLSVVQREYADVAHAIGIAYEAEGHPIVPGPVERIIDAVREDQSKASEADELRAENARLVGLIVQAFDQLVDNGYSESSPLLNEISDALKEHRRSTIERLQRRP